MKYSTKIIEQIHELISTADYTQKEICKIVNITPETYIKWRSQYSEFSEAIQKANDDRLEYFKTLARTSLLKLIKGYDYDEVTTEFVDDGHGKPKLKSKKTVKKHIKPDTVAVIFTLTNCDKEYFKHKNDMEGDYSKNNNKFEIIIEKSDTNTEA
jgi:predicted XRE-type DNA-binding protein